ncbi:unnamed protein product [Soboliphyme baturini]|uniref:MFS_1_like domain-containing protein n=1 Tax=Soboliphyme baturini TaxID=241478 RepID=A0A183IL99_9BILA|nr:unnamed protein product [Soboliphyme baturini]
MYFLTSFFFSLGGESLTLVQNIYLVKWFSGKELNFVFGFALSFGRVGSTITLNIMRPIYALIDQYIHGHVCLGMTMFVAAAFAFLSWMCSLVLVTCDRQRKRHKTAALMLAIDEDISESSEESEKVRCSDILHLSPKLWLLCFICVTYYTSIFPFVSNALISIALVVHVLFAFTFVIPYVIVVLSGISYSLLASSLWPCISYVAASKVLATAYGLISSVQNLGLALVYLYIGSLVDRHGYFLLELHFLILLSGKYYSTFFNLFHSYPFSFFLIDFGAVYDRHIDR